MSRGFWIGIFLVIAAVLIGAGRAFGSQVEAAVGINSDKAALLVRGIALAEGGWDADGNGIPGTRPFRNNNPGDLMEPGDQGQDSGGYGIFSSADFDGAQSGNADPSNDGFAALFHQVNLILSGQSRVYSLDMTWAQVAELYDKGGDALTAWLPNVASIAGILPAQTVQEWLDE